MIWPPSGTAIAGRAMPTTLETPEIKATAALAMAIPVYASISFTP
ncbi:hypothetical protein [Nocardia sp. NPDC059239]